MTRQDGAGGLGVGGVSAQGLHCLSGRASCESEQEPTSSGLLLLLFSEPRGVLFFCFFFAVFLTRGERNPVDGV